MGGLIGGSSPAQAAQAPGRQDFLETAKFIPGPEAAAEGQVDPGGAQGADVRRRGTALSDKPTGLGQAAGGRKTLLGE